MISIAITIILVWAFLVGYNRGLALQLFYSLGTWLALVLAMGGYKWLMTVLSMWVPYASPGTDSKAPLFSGRILFDLDQVFYAGLAFLILYVLTYGAVRLVGLFFGGLVNLRPLGPVGNGIAGLLAVCASWLVIEMVLMILATIPMPIIQNQLGHGLAKFMILHSPISAQFLQHSWVEVITKVKSLAP